MTDDELQTLCDRETKLARIRNAALRDLADVVAAGHGGSREAQQLAIRARSAQATIRANWRRTMIADGWPLDDIPDALPAST